MDVFDFARRVTRWFGAFDHVPALVAERDALKSACNEWYRNQNPETAKAVADAERRMLEAMKDAGLDNAPLYDLDVVPVVSSGMVRILDNRRELYDVLEELSRQQNRFKYERPEVDRACQQDFSDARGWLRRDPLALDLDGDGIETVGVDAGVLFDHNGDGIKTGTGWLKGDDAWLVLDRNGNGTIDSGRELFGVDTVVSANSAGTESYAADGFVALRSIDDNDDGVFNAADAEYANVRLWRDLNQDGISQADELQSLSQAGITSIDLTTKSATKTLAGGNTQTLAADIAGLEGEAAALNLADNPFYRQFTDTLDTSAVMDLPDMQGSGLVRDLREASTLSGTLEGQLRSLGTAGYVNRDTYLGEIRQIIDAWADTSSLKSASVRDSMTPLELQAEGVNGTSAGKHTIVPTGSGIDMTTGYTIAILYQPAGVDQTLLKMENGFLEVGSGGGSDPEGTAAGSGPGLTEEQKATQLAKWQRATYLIEVLERFNGQTFVNLEPDRVTDAGGRDLTVGVFDGTGSGGGGGPGGGVFPVFVTLSDAQLSLLEQSYAELTKSVYDGLLLQTRLKGYMDSIDLVKWAEPRKVSRGGTPLNGEWRVVA